MTDPSSGSRMFPTSALEDPESATADSGAARHRPSKGGSYVVEQDGSLTRKEFTLQPGEAPPKGDRPAVSAEEAGTGVDASSAARPASGKKRN